MKRRVAVSLIVGFGVTVALCGISELFIRVIPYRDLPMMPKPFFFYALSPGLIASTHVQHGWMNDAVFIGANVLAYATGFEVLVVLIRAFRSFISKHRTRRVPSC